MGSDNGNSERSSLSFERCLLIVFGIMSFTLLAFHREPEVHHHFYGSRGEGQAHHHYDDKDDGGMQTVISDSDPLLPTEQVGSTPLNTPNGSYLSFEHLDFDDLPDGPRDAALKLGYTRESWDNGEEDPPVFSQPWSKLLRDEREAAKALGFSAATWNKDEYESVSGSEDELGSESEEEYVALEDEESESVDNASSESESRSE